MNDIISIDRVIQIKQLVIDGKSPKQIEEFMGWRIWKVEIALTILEELFYGEWEKQELYKRIISLRDKIHLTKQV